MAQPHRLVIGLGNPGSDYALTRHNIGFMAVDAVADQLGASWSKRFRGAVAQADLAGTPFMMLKPTTFMNLSGEAAGEAMRFFRLPPADVIVFHDDIDLPPGKVKIKQGGGHAGHNGLKSLDAHIGPDYWRVRLGVGRPENKNYDVSDYVLGRFAKADAAWLDNLLENLARHFSLLLDGKQADYLKNIQGAAE